MNPFAAVAVKVAGAGAAAAIISLGIAGNLAQASAASPSPSLSAAAKAAPTVADRADRRVVRLAVVESEADALGITVKQLRADLKAGQKVSDLAKDKGITKEQFASTMLVSLKPRLEQLVAHKVITQARADRVVDHISKGHIPFWDGLHFRK